MGLPGWPGALNPPSSASTAAGSTGLQLKQGLCRRTLMTLMMHCAVCIRDGPERPHLPGFHITYSRLGQMLFGWGGGIPHTLPCVELHTVRAAFWMPQPLFVQLFQRRSRQDQLSLENEDIPYPHSGSCVTSSQTVARTWYIPSPS